MEKLEKNRRPLSLRYKLLLWLIPIVMIYTGVLIVINSNYILSSTSNSLEKTLTQTSEITAEHIADSISNYKKLTTLLASRVGAAYAAQITMPYEELDVASFSKQIAQLGVQYGFLHMMVAGVDGGLKTETHTNLKEVQADYFTEIMNGDQESYVSDVVMDKGTFEGKYVLNYSAPIKNAAGQTIGVLVCKADAADLSELVKNISVGEGGSTFIMDSNGQCIAHQNEAMLFSGAEYQEYKGNAKYPELNKLWDTMEAEDSGYMAYDYNGGRIAAFSTIEGTNNWAIAVTVSEEEFMKGAVDARGTAIMIAIVMIVLVSLFLAFVFRFTTDSIMRITNRLEEIVGGDLNTEVYIDSSSDETWRLSKSAAKLVGAIKSMINETEYALGEMAAGNLTVKLGGDFPGDFSEIRETIERNIDKLNVLIQRIARTSEEVARGSAQMASGASGLAQGASEQASSLEELFETVTSLAQRTYEIGGLDRKKLAEMDQEELDEAAATADALKRFEAADTLAEKLIIAIERIGETSNAIRRIAADIDSISSETGMLALNASVEATHAGDAGRGFSVIAAEIRNLSDKSRDAARDADSKINSISRAVSRGTQTVDVTVSTIGEMTMAMNQVKSALGQISNVVENIAATAEETAAGSEELSAQADLLKSLVAEFKYHSDLDETIG